MMSGVLLLNKPSGLTSHDCVDRVRKIVRMKQVGHMGTLDPRAKGLLPLCLGRATKLLPYLSIDMKRYEFTVRLGIATSTQDMDGEILCEKIIPPFSQDRLQELAHRYVQEPYYQKTPAFSARKFQGQKLYQMARQGQAIPELPPKLVKVTRLQLSKLNEETLSGELDCGSGTYVRQLVEDMAQDLGTVGVLFNLTRTQVGPWELKQSIPLELLEVEGVNSLKNGSYFIPSTKLLGDRPRFDLTPGLWHQLKQGVQPIRISRFDLKNDHETTGDSVGHGDLICGMVTENDEPRIGALLSVAMVRHEQLVCKVQKLLP